LKNRVALITGSAHGIGRGIALAYAREGAKIVVNDLDHAPSAGQAEAVAALIGDAGGEAEVCLGDASETADMERVIAAVVERFGRLDILVNNANPGQRDPSASRAYLDVTAEQLYQGYFLPFKTAYVNTQLAARRMIAQGEGGQIITITSVHQERPWPSDSLALWSDEGGPAAAGHESGPRAGATADQSERDRARLHR
jgi:glucose 1-dehydrogenase